MGGQGQGPQPPYNQQGQVPMDTNNSSSSTNNSNYGGNNINGHRGGGTPNGNNSSSSSSNSSSGPPKLARIDNRARIYGLGLHNNKVNLNHQKGCPWMLPGKPYSRGPVG